MHLCSCSIHSVMEPGRQVEGSKCPSYTELPSHKHQKFILMRVEIDSLSSTTLYHQEGIPGGPLPFCWPLSLAVVSSKVDGRY